MMTTIDISKFIEQPLKSEVNHKEDLKKYTEKYPYASLFSILYLKNLSNSSDIHFEDELVKHSYRISDREQLYNLIHQHSPNEKIVEIIEEKETEILTIPNSEKEEIIAPVFVEEKEEKEEFISINLETIEPQIEENILDIEVERKDIEITPNILEEENDVVDESILQHALSANYQLSELNDEEIIQLNEKNNLIEEKEEIQEEKPKVEIQIDTKQSFKSWLNSNSNYQHSEDTEKPSIPNLEKVVEPEKSKKELLEELKKPKKTFFSPTEKGRESLNEDTLPVSETLAKIYALQGNFPKAISAYMQLSLINPEKKIFFALRIKELEQKLKHK